jgi:hypothetical protein
LLIDRNNIEAKNTMKDLISEDKNAINRKPSQSFLTDLMQHRLKCTYVSQNSKNKEAKTNSRS